MKKLYILLLGISLGGIAPFLQGTEPDKNVQLKQRPFSWEDVKNLPNILFVMGSIVHELGHALTAKLLTNSDIDIHIGARPRNRPESYLFKKYGFTIYELKPDGCANFNYFSKGEETAVLAAGPLAGTSFYGLLGKNIVTHFKNYKNVFSSLTVPTKTVFLTSGKLTWSASMVKEAFCEILYGFTPLWGPEGDGYKILHNLGISNKLLDQFVCP